MYLNLLKCNAFNWFWTSMKTLHSTSKWNYYVFAFCHESQTFHSIVLSTCRLKLGKFWSSGNQRGFPHPYLSSYPCNSFQGTNMYTYIRPRVYILGLKGNKEAAGVRNSAWEYWILYYIQPPTRSYMTPVFSLYLLRLKPVNLLRQQVHITLNLPKPAVKALLRSGILSSAKAKGRELIHLYCEILKETGLVQSS